MSYGCRKFRYNQPFLYKRNTSGRHVHPSSRKNGERHRGSSHCSNTGDRRNVIRTTTNRVEAQSGVSHDSPQHQSRRSQGSKSVASYLGVFLAIISLVAIGYQPPQETETMASASNTGDQTLEANQTSIDDVMATSAAASLAQTSNMPVATNVANLSQTLEAESTLAKSSDNTVAKPQIVQPTTNTREIKTYTAKRGDTVQSVSKMFNISPETIRSSNGLDSDALAKDQKVKILPVNGVLYTVASGDTIDSIASDHGANKTAIIAFNDLEVSGIEKGNQIVIPGGSAPEEEEISTPATASPQQTSGIDPASGTAVFGGGSARANNLAASVGNRYAFGNCTWYVYERRAQLGSPVGSFWGNASSWASYAASSGYRVDSTPAAGAVMQNGGGFYGHVAVVESVNPGVSVSVSEMNAYRFGGGFNRIGRGEIPWSEAVSGMYRYIH